MSSVGGGSKDNFGGGGGSKGNNNKNDAFNEWLDPVNRDDGGKDANKIRKQRADARLPISYRTDTDTRDEEFNLSPDEENDEIPSSSSALKRIQSGKALSNIDITKNPFFDTVSRLTPSEMILRFTTTSHPRVQDAVKSTILGLIGTLPRMKTEGGSGDNTNGFSTKTVTTAERLAGLMFQLQMTGYMFKNAEYRMALSQSVEHMNKPKFLIRGSSPSEEVTERDEDSTTYGKVRGKVQVQYSKTKMEIDAEAYVSELRSEIKRLRDEIALAKSAKEEEMEQQDLLSYIRTLPPQEMRELTGSMTEDVLSAMKGLVNAVMVGISGIEQDGQVRVIAPNTVLEQSGEAMAQLCMWQLVSGYNLRELEVREEMKLKLKNGRDGEPKPKDAKVQNDDDYDDEFTPGLDSGGME